MSRFVSMVLVYGICLLQILERSLLISRGNIVSSIFYEYGNGRADVRAAVPEVGSGDLHTSWPLPIGSSVQKSGDFHQESISLRIIRG